MQPLSAVLWMCFVSGLWWIVAAAAEGGRDVELWRRISLESSWLQPSIRQTPRNLSLIPCGAVCMRQDWCHLWCHEAPRECLLTSLTASASYKPAQPVGALSCYTSHLPDLAVGAAITSSPHYHVDVKQRENLVDGIYGGEILDCALVVTGGGALAWFLLDLGAAYPISEVLLVAQPNTNVVHFFRDIEVRVGSVQMAGDFTTYQVLGTFTGIAEPEQTIVLRPAAPITGRYVSIQRTTDNHLQIAHLEIR